MTKSINGNHGDSGKGKTSKHVKQLNLNVKSSCLSIILAAHPYYESC